MRNFKIHSLSNFQIYNPVLFTIVIMLHILYSHGLFILSQEGCTFWSPSVSPTLHCQWSPMFSVVFKISSISEIKWYLSFSNVSFGASLFGSDDEVSAYNAGDPGSIPGSGRSSGEVNGNPLQYSCLENPTDWGARYATVHGVPKSRTRLVHLV